MAVIQSFLNRQVLNRFFFYPPMQWRHQAVALPRQWRYLLRQEISRTTYLFLNIAAGAARRVTGAPWTAAWLIHP
jgi:hypothetical protein